MIDPDREIHDDKASMNKWIKVSIIIGIAVAFAIIVMAAFGGEHNPMRHLS